MRLRKVLPLVVMLIASQLLVSASFPLLAADQLKNEAMQMAGCHSHADAQSDFSFTMPDHCQGICLCSLSNSQLVVFSEATENFSPVISKIQQQPRLFYTAPQITLLDRPPIFV